MSQRTRIARLRAHRVKVAFGLVAVAAFVVAMLFARMSYAGHSKNRPVALNPPRRFLGIVKASRLQGGVVAPPQAPPQAVSAPS
jgi:hypothetical protein